MVLADLIERIRGGHLDMPDLQLTAPGTRRLWDLDRRASDELLRRLIEDRVLPGAKQTSRAEESKPRV